MAVSFAKSRTRTNIINAFFMESADYGKYMFCAGEAAKTKLYIIEKIFIETANQELEHQRALLRLFLSYSSEMEIVESDEFHGREICNSITGMLDMAVKNEYEQHEKIYNNYAETAAKEGFRKCHDLFEQLKGIERIHGDRYLKYYDLCVKNEMFSSDIQYAWMCIKCGFVQVDLAAPLKCPVCGGSRGNFARMQMDIS